MNRDAMMQPPIGRALIGLGAFIAMFALANPVGAALDRRVTLNYEIYIGGFHNR